MEHQINHLGIILDGNRRFAKRLMLEPWKGHEYGREKVEALLEWLKEANIKEVSLYCLSIENINNRPKNELDYLMKLFRDSFREMDRKKLEENKIRIKFAGNLSLLPLDVQAQCLKLEEETKNNNKFTVNFCMAYGGRQEIIEAVKRILKNKIDPEKFTEKDFESSLYLSSQPDLIIRTGGEKRTSNFLPFQAAYSEWLFLDKFWPEFTKEDLQAAIQEYSNRKRNFGK